jgi:hypothetical protein
MLDGEGVFECLHPGLQMLDFALLLFHEQMFSLARSRLDGIESRVVVGKSLADLSAIISTAFSTAISTSFLIAGIFLIVFMVFWFIHA